MQRSFAGYSREMTGKESGTTVGQTLGAPTVSDAAIIRELERDAEVLVLQHRDDLLQIVAVLAGDTHLVFLDRGLHADLAVLDKAHDLLGALDRDALLARDLLA